MHSFYNNLINTIFKNRNYKFTILVLIFSLSFGYFAGSKNFISKIFAQGISPSNFISSSNILSETVYNSADNKSLSYNNPEMNSELYREVNQKLGEKFVSWRATYTPPTSREIEESMVAGYVNAFKDPYTTYFPPVEAKNFKDTVKGSFGGVGMEVGNKEGNITVIAPLKDSPAMKIGIKAGDIILKIDDKDVSGMSTEQVVNLIRGEIGTEVRVTTINKIIKTPKEFKIKRQEIKIPTIDGKIVNGIYIISLYSFSAESPELFKNALIKFAESGTNRLIVDLRGNPGGYLEAAVDIASFFLPEGKVVVSEKGNDPSNNVELRSRGYNVFGDKLKLYVIVDEGSASASEILAGALQDHKVAKVYGQKSYGKGSVQELIDLKNGGSLKVTIAKWYTPNGRSITEDKIVPDILIPRTATTTLDSETKNIVNLILKENKVINKKL